MLAAGSIDLIYLGIQFFKLYKGQTTFGEVEDIMSLNNYKLYGLFEINCEGNGCLNFCNALYVSPNIYEKLNPHYLF